MLSEVNFGKWKLTTYEPVEAPLRTLDEFLDVGMDYQERGLGKLTFDRRPVRVEIIVKYGKLVRTVVS